MKIYSTFKDQKNLYFELEYIKGCTILSQIRFYNKNIHENVAFYGGEVIQALQYLHNHNIIYRDLKPENIMISVKD